MSAGPPREMPGAGALAASQRVAIDVRSGHGARVEFRGVSVRYAESGRPGHGGEAAVHAAVENLSLVVEPGEICVLVGPSGCGKTTTLKLVNRLVEPTAGQVLLDGKDVAQADPVALRRGIGYVIQQIGLFPHQTVAQNVATVPRLLGWPNQKVTHRVTELIELVGLDPARVSSRFPAQLSGGERQRVGVARALAAEPPLLLMDEPFGAVDPVVRERLQDEFKRIQRALGTTVLFVTHDIDEAVKLGTRVAVFRTGGRLAQHDSPVDLLARPADDYVARFTGTDRTLKRLSLLTLKDVPLRPMLDGLANGTPLPVTLDARAALSELLGREGHRASVERDGVVVGYVTLEDVARLAGDT